MQSSFFSTFPTRMAAPGVVLSVLVMVSTTWAAPTTTTSPSEAMDQRSITRLVFTYSGIPTEGNHQSVFNLLPSECEVKSDTSNKVTWERTLGQCVLFFDTKDCQGEGVEEELDLSSGPGSLLFNGNDVQGIYLCPQGTSCAGCKDNLGLSIPTTTTSTAIEETEGPPGYD